MDASAPAKPPIAMTCQSFRSLAGAPKALPARHRADYERAASALTGKKMPHKPGTLMTSRRESAHCHSSADELARVMWTGH